MLFLFCFLIFGLKKNKKKEDNLYRRRWDPFEIRKQRQGAAKERICGDVSNCGWRTCQICGMNDCSRQLVSMSA